MAPGTEVSFRRHLLDPEYWRPRLKLLKSTPRRLLVFPRPEQSRPGTELVEFRVRAHDDQRLVGMLARRAYGRDCDMIRLRACRDIDAGRIDWEAVGDGITDLIIEVPEGRRLTDRVLDALRLTQAACSIESVGFARVVFGDGGGCGLNDALCIAEMIRSRGWL